MFYAFGGAESGLASAPADPAQGSGFYTNITANDTIIAAPGAFPGNYAYSIDPVGGNGQDQYGFIAPLTAPALFTVPFMFRFEDDFDAATSICEVGLLSALSPIARRLIISNAEGLQIIDREDDVVGQTAAAYVAKDTDYWFLWYIDLRTPACSRDILWVWKAGAWDKAIDVSNHGVGSASDIGAITFGSSHGKAALPTAGGPFYVSEQVVHVLDVSPNTTPLGSITTKFKVPTANGTDGDFNTGTGDNPDWEDVNEVPPNSDATYDEGDTAGDKQGYEIGDADGGDTPLAVQVIGAGKASHGTGISLRIYVLEDGTYDYGTTYHQAGTTYRILPSTQYDQDVTFNEVNGQPLTEALFNSLEAGVELTAMDGSGRTWRVTQIGLEYMIVGPKALPDDFPTEILEVEDSPLGGPAIGSENVLVF